MSDIKAEIESRDVRMRVVPVKVLADIEKDIAHLREHEELNGFQKWIVNDAYVLKLPVPEPDFTAKSIVITATPSAMTFVQAVFRHGNKTASDLFDYPQSGAGDVVAETFASRGYKLQYIHWFPQKRFAVRSGLSEYGRNNLAYTGGMGSFCGIATYKSDMPCGDYTWREVKNMTACDDCRLCLDNCPTGAIQSERFLLDNEKCLTKHNESGTAPFADWIPKTAHHSLIGCLRCQNICPKNQEVLSRITIAETIEFSEEETGHLLAGTPIENLPKTLADKVHLCWMHHYYASIPRNLAAMFENS